MPRLFAIDSMAVLFRGYFAMIRTPLINSKGLNTSGIRTLLMQLIKIIEEEGTNAYDLLKYNNIIFTTSSIKSLQQRLSNEKI